MARPILSNIQHGRCVSQVWPERERIMDWQPPSNTSPTLLGRLRCSPNDEQAWNDFVDRYAPKVYSWALRWGLQQADAEEVTQDVLVRLATRMKSFEYDPSLRFRGWLKTVTQNAWRDFVAKRGKAIQPQQDSQGRNFLESTEARDDLVKRLEDEFDLELFERALELVRNRVAKHTWQAFYLTEFQGADVTEVAKQLDMKAATIYVARGKVSKMLRDEVRLLEQG